MESAHLPSGAFEGVVVAPYSELLDSPGGLSDHRGGPHWPDWEKQTWARHQRGNRPVDAEPVRVDARSRLRGSMVWAGPVVTHFGHQVADFGMRIAPSLIQFGPKEFLFATHPRYGFRSINDTPRFFRQLLAWYGIGTGQASLLAEASIVGELLVAAQSEQLQGPEPRPEILAWLAEHAHRRLGRMERSGTIYVSRAGMTARFAGEVQLELLMRRAGVAVMRPELLPLDEQLRAYVGAERVVFAEGSAIHSVQLLGGRALGHVAVLVRRSGARLAARAIYARAESVRYLEAVAGLVHGLRVTGEAAVAVGMPVLAPEQLQDVLWSAGIDIRRHWSSRDWAAAVEKDIIEWAGQELAGPRGRVPGAVTTIAATATTVGLEALIPQINRLAPKP